MFAAEALVLPTGLITLAVLTRKLGTSEYGLLTLAATAVAWIEWSLSAMLSRATNKWISGSADWKPVATTALQLYLLVGIVVAGCLILAANPLAAGLGEPALAGYLRLYAFDIPLFGLALGYRNTLIGIGAFRERAWMSVGRLLVRLVLVVALVSLGLSVSGAIIATLGATLIEVVVARRFVPVPLWGRSGFSARKLLATAVPLLFLGVLLRLFDNLDLYILKALGASATQAGWYGAAENLSVVPGLFAQSFSPVLLATLMRLRRENQHEYARAIARDALRLPLLLLPLAAIVAGSSSQIVSLLAGPSFVAAGPLLQWLIFAAMGIVLVSVATSLLVVADRSAWTLAVAGPMVLTALFGHLWAIPRYGPIGAAAVTTICAGLGALAAQVAAASRWRIAPRVGSIVRSFAISAVLYVLAVAWGAAGWALVAKLGLLGILALGLYLLLGEFDSRERALAWSLLPWASSSRS